MRKLYIFIFLLISAVTLTAQVPSGYYDGTDGLVGDDLKAALHDIIKNDSHLSYNGLWNAYKVTDKKPNGYVWDIYSDVPDGETPYDYTFIEDECHTKDNGEGDCYNREHLWPQSWATGTSHETDLHHVFPTDKYVNAQRGNYAFGEVNNVTETFMNGSKLGNCKSSLGYSGTVYEPIDEYKGDIARALMYVSVRYYTEDSDWPQSSYMANKSVLKDWAIALLLKWHREDPVSQKEINRNNAVYGKQNNRNPFVDYPDFAEMIWNPNWSSSYQVTASANPANGGEASVKADATTTASIDFSQQGYESGQEISSVTLDAYASVVFNKGSNSNQPKYYSTGTAIRCYGGNNFRVSTSMGTITKIVLTYGDGDGTNAITTNTGTFSTNIWTGDAASVTFTIGGSSGHRRIKGIDVTYSYEGTPAASATCAYGATATLTAMPNTGYHFVSWTINNTVVSENPYSFTVTGNATCQANFEINTYDISVAANPTEWGDAFIGNAPSPSEPHEASVDFSVKYASVSTSQVLNGTNVVFDDNNVSVGFNKGTNNSNPPTYYNNGKSVRCYGGNYFEVSTNTGNISQIVLTYGSSDGSNAITTNVGSFSTDTWTGDATTVRFTIGGTSGNRRIKTITVTYVTGGGAPPTEATFNYGETATITAVPNEGYAFVNWTNDGQVVSTEATYEFQVTTDADLVANFGPNTITQTSNLVSGWNWFSTYITVDDPVDMLDMLKESLGENADQIQSFYYTTEFDGEEWFGDLDEVGIYNEQMYLIMANTACTVELQGAPANVDEYEITIRPGWNWMGFPSSETIDVADAMADFEAGEGDQIQSKYYTTEFDGDEWFGDLEAFVPGQGYLYYSSSNATKILVFRTIAKGRKIR